MLKKHLGFISVCLMVFGCGPSEQEEAALPTADNHTSVEVMDQNAGDGARSLDEILNSLPAEAQARIPFRHPKETLEFFSVAPGMTVVDTTPGDVWYTGILAAYLGKDGKVIGADRPLEVWEYFGPDYFTAQVRAQQENWPSTWPEEQAEKHGKNAASFDAIAYGKVPTDMAEKADVVMMIREIHNIMGADESGALVSKVLGEIHMLLKDGGVFGIVQHRAPETASDKWANGFNGYVKQSTVVALAEAAGFTLESTSDINANPKDQPTEDDFVWRLPPTLDLPEGDTALREAMLAIGESDRMTLKFRKAP